MPIIDFGNQIWLIIDSAFQDKLNDSNIQNSRYYTKKI